MVASGSITSTLQSPSSTRPSISSCSAARRLKFPLAQARWVLGAKESNACLAGCTAYGASSEKRKLGEFLLLLATRRDTSQRRGHSGELDRSSLRSWLRSPLTHHIEPRLDAVRVLKACSTLFFSSKHHPRLSCRQRAKTLRSVVSSLLVRQSRGGRGEQSRGHVLDGVEAH